MKFNLFCIFAAIAVLILAVISRTSAYPGLSEVDELEEPEAFEEPLEEIHSRIRRATCDLFSFQSKWVTPNHAACAAHCLVLGKKGGRCKNTICHCRN